MEQVDQLLLLQAAYMEDILTVTNGVVAHTLLLIRVHSYSISARTNSIRAHTNSIRARTYSIRARINSISSGSNCIRVSTNTILYIILALIQ